MKLRADLQEEVDRVVAEALGQSEPGPRVEVSVHVFNDDRPPRYPAVGLHPGAIPGSVPHQSRILRG